MEVVLSEQDRFTSILRRMHEKNGSQFYLDMTTEESAEVVQAINKIRRFNDEKSWANLHSEIADLQICLDLLYTNVLSHNEVQECYRKKMKKLEGYLTEEVCQRKEEKDVIQVS